MNSNLFKQEINTNKKHLWLWAGFLILSFMISFIIARDTPLEYDRYSTFFFVYLMITTISYGIMLFFTTLIQFDFMHNKFKLDFYHNLPISRKSLFLTKFSVPIAILTIPYFIGALIAYAYSLYLSTFSNSVESIALIHMLYLIIIYTVSSLLLYSFLTFMGTLTGKTVYQVVVFIQTIIFATIFPIFSISTMQNVINPGISIEPIIMLFFGNLPELLVITILIIIEILFVILFTLLSLKYYKKYKSENAGTFLSPTLKKVYIILTSFFIGSIFTASIIVIFELNNIFIESTLIILAISLFSYLVLNILINKKKTINIKEIIILIVLCIAFVLITIADLFNFNGKTPNINSINNAHLNNTNVSDFEGLVELQQLVADNSLPYYTSHYQDYYSYNNFDSELSSEYTNEMDNSFFTIYFSYNLSKENNPLYFHRTYLVPATCTEVIDALSDFYTSKEYKENVINDLEQLKKDSDNSEIYVQNGINSLDFNNTNQINDLIDCLITDIENDDSFGYYNEQPMTIINLTMYYGNNSYTDFSLNSNYRNTLNYLNNEYKLQFGDDTSILDSLSIRVFNKDIQQIFDYANANGIEYINSSLIPYNSYDAVYEYSNPDDRETLFELLQIPVYTTPFNNIIKLDSNAPYLYLNHVY